MKLIFRRIGGYVEKEIPIMFNLGTLEATCKGLGLEFHEMKTSLNKTEFDIEFLYQGYITACKERYKKPKYTRSHAIIWNEHLSRETKADLLEKMNDFLGTITTTNKKKVNSRSKQHGQKSEALPSEN